MGIKRRITEKRGNPKRRTPRSIRRFKKKDRGNEIAVARVNALIRETEKEKGQRSEDLFEHAFEEEFRKPFWFERMCKATSEQDRFEGTDFILETIFGDKVRFDVKSSRCGYRKQIETTITKKIQVWPIIVDPIMTFDDIRALVFSMAKRQIEARRAASGAFKNKKQCA